VKEWSEVIKITNGRSYKSVIDPKGKYPILGSAGKTMGYSNEYLCEEETTIIGRKGNINNPIFIETKFWNVDTAFGLIALEDLDKRFLFYFCKSFDFTKMDRGSGRPSLVKTDLKKIPIPIPPLSEQQKIVTLLDEAFKQIEQAKANIEQNIVNAKELFQSKLNEIFSQRGDGWEEKSLGKISERVSVGHVGSTSKYYCGEEGVPFLRSQNVRKGFINLSKIKYITKDFHEKLKKSQLKKGDLLFVRVGVNRGDCTAITEEMGNLNCANIVFARPTSENVKFIESYFMSPIGRERLLGLTTGAAQGVINTKSIAKTIIPLPNEDIQNVIVKDINKLNDYKNRIIKGYESKLKNLEELKKSLLEKAFNGELTS
jgi:type I restriction enzyme S subunit